MLLQYKRGDITEAAKSGDVKKIDWCLAHGAYIDEADTSAEYARTALLWAARKGHKTAVEFLVQRKASLTAIDKRKGSFCVAELSG